MNRLSFIVILILLAGGVIAAVETPRSIEIHFADGNSEKYALDSATTVELRDDLLTFRTATGHIDLLANGLTGWDLSSEEGQTLLNDLVSSEKNIESSGPVHGALVQISGRKLNVLAAESETDLFLSTPEGRDVISARTDGRGFWQSPQLAPGVYILSLKGFTYKFLIK